MEMHSDPICIAESNLVLEAKISLRPLHYAAANAKKERLGDW
jgi:hypothetical protein